VHGQGCLQRRGESTPAHLDGIRVDGHLVPSNLDERADREDALRGHAERVDVDERVERAHEEADGGDDSLYTCMSSSVQCASHVGDDGDDGAVVLDAQQRQAGGHLTAARSRVHVAGRGEDVRVAYYGILFLNSSQVASRQNQQFVDILLTTYT